MIRARRRSRLRDAVAGLGLPGSEPDWTLWLDGRPRRLKRGKHYTGEPKPLEKRAKEAAQELGKPAVTSKDGSGEYEYLWIQFVDGEVELGEPCPMCGGHAHGEVQKYFLRCFDLRATLGLDDRRSAAGEHSPPCPRQSGSREPRARSQHSGRGPRTAGSASSGDRRATRVVPSGEEVEVARARRG